jgi:hypothetical protein
VTLLFPSPFRDFSSENPLLIHLLSFFI